MRRTVPILLLALAVSLSLAAPVSADTIQSTNPSTAAAQPFPGALGNTGNPYWNQPSADGTNMNIGYFITNTGAFAGSTTGPGALPYWGLPGGAADPSFYFTNNSAGTIATLLIEIAGYAPSNVFGWYSTSNPSINAVIFPGPAGAGATTTISIPVTDYGFFLYVAATGQTYYTQSGLNTPSNDRNHQHFAVFIQPSSNGPVYWIGMEDLKIGDSTLVNREGGVGDYNDMVVRITPIPTPVPEPGTLALFGSGVLGIARLVRRQNRK